MSATTAIKKRPILMSGPMIRAILGRTKSMTRRVIKPQPAWRVIPDSERSKFNDTGWWWTRKNGTGIHSQPDEAALIETFSRCLNWCPYGKPGDRLWVRETFTRNGFKVGEKVFYRADGESQFMGEMRESNGNITRYHTDHWERNCEKKPGSDWKPSIHMPRWASRITLEITEVRVERLQDISVQDVRAEGIPETFGDWGAMRFPGFESHVWDNMRFDEQWKLCWESINGKGSWDLNPWVWAISFRRLEAS